MLFNSLRFILFLPAVVLLYYCMPSRLRPVWLLVCSYYFYMCWNAVYILLILFTTVVTYFCALGIASAAGNAGRRRLWLLFSLALNLGVLFFFKYLHFAIDSLNSALALVGGLQLNHPAFDVLLPVGISFYTFQALGYTIDVYRGDVEAERSFIYYALFVSFFPQLVAGPIERSGRLLGQLREPARPSFEAVKDGCFLMLWGFFLKIVLADRIGLAVDAVYGEYFSAGASDLIFASLLFAVQIYCDFCGYSVIAMGAAKLLGVELMENFNTPYLAQSTSEFWRRWHISLSSWFRDYLYIPLGGNRKGKLRKYLNLMITFTVSGLWHGAAWGYVAWGFINGLYQVIGDLMTPVKRWLTRVLDVNTQSFSHRLAKTVFTFICIDLSWVFFRARSIGVALYILREMARFRPSELLLGLPHMGLGQGEFTLVLIGIGVMAAAGWLRLRTKRSVRELIYRQDYWFQALVAAFGLCFILYYGVWGPTYQAANFIYFQF